MFDTYHGGNQYTMIIIQILTNLRMCDIIKIKYHNTKLMKRRQKYGADYVLK